MKTKEKLFTCPVVLPNTIEVREVLMEMGYRKDRGNSEDHINIVTSSETYYTTNSNAENVLDFNFPVWKGTKDCRKNIVEGLKIASQT